VHRLFEATQTLPVTQDFVASRFIFVLFGTSCLGETLLNASIRREFEDEHTS
jgi:hypothetical protein